MVNVLVVLYLLMNQAVPTLMAGATKAAPSASGSSAKDASAAYEKGRKLVSARKYDQAIVMADKCLALAPTKAECHLLAGASYASLNQVEKGAQHYREFLKLAPNHKKASSVRAILEAYDKEKSPSAGSGAGEARAAFEDGYNLFRAKQFNEAVLMAKKCLAIDPAMADCHKLAGATYAVMNEQEKGAHHYREFLRLAPDREDAPRIRYLLEQYDAQKGK
jgi:Flp pilus assembly protein TadD